MKLIPPSFVLCTKGLEVDSVLSREADALATTGSAIGSSSVTPLYVRRNVRISMFPMEIFEKELEDG